MHWADTPTHATPVRTSSGERNAQSGLASSPLLTLSHSTTTVPEKAEASAGRRTHHAGPVRRGGAWAELEAAVLAHLAVVDERAGHALGDQLDLHPSDVGHVGAVGGGGEEGSPGAG